MREYVFTKYATIKSFTPLSEGWLEIEYPNLEQQIQASFPIPIVSAHYCVWSTDDFVDADSNRNNFHYTALGALRDKQHRSRRAKLVWVQLGTTW